LGSNVADGHKVGQIKLIDEKTLLQVNASMVIGVLFVLTLSSFITGTGYAAEPFLGIITAYTAVPFAASSFLLLWPVKNTYIAGLLTCFGFLAFGIVVVVVGISPGYTSEADQPVRSDIERRCAMNPERYNLTDDPWKCSEFTDGSLAKRCVSDYKKFNQTSLRNCSKFIPQSS
jgi:hypothetical protein